MYLKDYSYYLIRYKLAYMKRAAGHQVYCRLVKHFINWQRNKMLLVTRRSLPHDVEMFSISSLSFLFFWVFDACWLALRLDALNILRALFERSELVRFPQVSVRPILIWPDWASMV